MLQILERTLRTQTPKDHEFLEYWKIELEKLGAKQILQWAIETFYPNLALATSFGVNGYVILSMLTDLGCDIESVNIGFNEKVVYQFEAILLDAGRDPVSPWRPPVLRWDENFGPVKIAPLARWSEAMLRNKLLRDSFDG